MPATGSTWDRHTLIYFDAYISTAIDSTGARGMGYAFWGVAMHLVTAGSLVCALAALSGCASQTGVVPNGQGGYLIAK
jgi:hypothetical protein